VEEGVAPRSDGRHQAIAVGIDEGGLKGVVHPSIAAGVEGQVRVIESEDVGGAGDGEGLLHAGIERVAFFDEEGRAAAVEGDATLAAGRAAGLEVSPAGRGYGDGAAPWPARIDDDAVGRAIGVTRPAVHQVQGNDVAVDLRAGAAVEVEGSDGPGDR